jgi:hypothetical protein
VGFDFHNPTQKPKWVDIPKDKLSPRKEKAIIIGYNQYNHYKLWDLNKNKALWSRDVTILENSFLEPQPNHPIPRDLNQYDYIDIRANNSPIKESSSATFNKNNNSIGESRVASPDQSRPMTRSKIRDISTIPNHRVETQIPQRNMNINNFVTPWDPSLLFPASH